MRMAIAPAMPASMTRSRSSSRWSQMGISTSSGSCGERTGCQPGAQCVCAISGRSYLLLVREEERLYRGLPLLLNTSQTCFFDLGAESEGKGWKVSLRLQRTGTSAMPSPTHGAIELHKRVDTKTRTQENDQLRSKPAAYVDCGSPRLSSSPSTARTAGTTIRRVRDGSMPPPSTNRWARGDAPVRADNRLAERIISSMQFLPPDENDRPKFVP